jgi:hypothetical protein
MKQGNAEADAAEKIVNLGADLLLEGRPANGGMPDPKVMARWRREADGRVESALARFDDQMVHGRAAHQAAKEAIAEVIAWVGWSLARVPRLVTTLPLTLGPLPDWERMGSQVSLAAKEDPDGVDRFLRLYLAMTHELAARGFTTQAR